mmetsp:Transcript_9956/g.18131  ORF Transcript_9956/g.18131 Transcript_9956/m.18131 type:complete len:231 (+) Transcript_9956:149-841(+)|eukprot:CAMPEP_0197520828 /NCGR_PEP_ID=MMETSP1318-20131121/6149_1 /TAXON_ID=552666 /ORGANISM="Partenskyella glossopodia, Strain RCC365" /LENGTH=230 /DNA_ID=CAMNT_0043072565 /DNA_START=305 /DNA_END=997 /DNA_ORIENTATION=+
MLLVALKPNTNTNPKSKPKQMLNFENTNVVAPPLNLCELFDNKDLKLLSEARMATPPPFGEKSPAVGGLNLDLDAGFEWLEQAEETTDKNVPAFDKYEAQVCTPGENTRQEWKPDEVSATTVEELASVEPEQVKGSLSEEDKSTKAQDSGVMSVLPQQSILSMEALIKLKSDYIRTQNGMKRQRNPAETEHLVKRQNADKRQKGPEDEESRKARTALYIAKRLVNGSLLL